MPTRLMVIGARGALRFSEIFVAFSSMVLAAEMMQERGLFADHGLLPWCVDRLSHPVMDRLFSRLSFDRIFEDKNFRRLQLIRFAVSILLVFLVCTGRSTWAPLLILVALTLVSHLRCSASNDGSDQFTLIILIACTLSELVGTSLLYKGGCYFIAGEAMVAYSTSGWLKLLEPGWRDGSIVTGVLASSTFGNRSLYLLFTSHATLAILSGWIVSVGDCALGIAPLLPPPVTLLLLLLGFALHVGIARVLGLNTFLWAFCATYAPTYFVSNELYRFLFGR